MNNNEQEQLDKIGNESVIDEHLKENSVPLSKRKVSREDLVTYVAMVLILIAAIVLVYIFLDKQGANPFKKSTTTSQQLRTIDTTLEQYVQPKTINTTTTQSNPVRTEGTTNIDEGATVAPPTTFHTVPNTN